MKTIKRKSLSPVLLQRWTLQEYRSQGRRKGTSVTAINGLYLLIFTIRIRHLSFLLLGNVAQGAWQQVINKWYGNFRKSRLNRVRSNRHATDASEVERCEKCLALL